MQHVIIGTLLIMMLACDKSPQPAESHSEEECMAAIVAQDDTLGRYRNHACEDTSLSAAISNYALALQALDYSSCPAIFEQAFQSHSTAWLNLLPVVDKHDSLRGEMHELFDQLSQSSDSTAFKPLVAKVWSTWAEVEKAME